MKNQEQEIEENTKKDLPSIYILILFFLYLFLYSIPSLLLNDMKFSASIFTSGLSPTLASFVVMLPILVVVFVIQKIRKQPYYRSTMHLAIGSLIFFIYYFISKVLPSIFFILN